MITEKMESTGFHMISQQEAGPLDCENYGGFGIFGFDGGCVFFATGI
jgi:hypothetical protein